MTISPRDKVRDGQSIGGTKSMAVSLLEGQNPWRSVLGTRSRAVSLRDKVHGGQFQGLSNNVVVL